VIPREGVESVEDDEVGREPSERVIPREGVESSKIRQVPLLLPRVIPREGVESASAVVEWSPGRYASDPERGS